MIPSGGVIGRTRKTVAFDIAAHADRDQAVVSIGGIERARTSRGVALVIVDPRGEIEAYTLDGSRNLRVPFDDQVLPLFRVTTGARCADVGNAGWQDISHLAARRMSVRIDNYRTYLSHTILYIAGNSPATPRLTPVSGRGAPQLAVQTFRTILAEERDRLRLAARSDGMQMSESLAASPFVSRLELRVDDEGEHRAVRMDVGMDPAGTFVRAAVDLNNPRRATVCGIS
jgi:hypothetical protein